MTTALPQRIAAVVLLAALLVLAALGVASASDGAATASDESAASSDDEVEIGTAVYYERAEDGSVVMVVRD